MVKGRNVVKFINVLIVFWLFWSQFLVIEENGSNILSGEQYLKLRKFTEFLLSLPRNRFEKKLSAEFSVVLWKLLVFLRRHILKNKCCTVNILGSQCCHQIWITFPITVEDLLSQSPTYNCENHLERQCRDQWDCNEAENLEE